MDYGFYNILIEVISMTKMVKRMGVGEWNWQKDLKIYMEIHESKITEKIIKLKYLYYIF